MLRVCDGEVDAQEEPMYGARARMSGLAVCEVVCGGRVCRCWREKVKLSDECFGGTAGLKCFRRAWCREPWPAFTPRLHWAAKPL